MSKNYNSKNNSNNKPKTAQVSIGKSINFELPIYYSSQGSGVVDVSSFHKQAGMFTYDPGFISTAACKSAITFIDGAKGIMRYRGYAIEDLVQHKSYIEMFYLLLHGELPSVKKLSSFKKQISGYQVVYDDVRNVIKSFDSNKHHPMGMLMSVIAYLASGNHDQCESVCKKGCANACECSMFKSIFAFSQLSVLIPMIYRHCRGKGFVDSKPSLGHAKNILYMMFGGDKFEPHLDDDLVHAFDVIMSLHADHGQNASTTTLRIVSSSGASLLTSISAAIGSLWGPAHGGANEAVIHMLREIGSVDKVPEFVSRVKKKENKVRLMGFGHRVYKNFDPRAKVIKKACGVVLNKINNTEYKELFEVARALENVALQDDYFVSRNLYPNVDFYSGLILSALGIPSDFFTVIFALSRSAGWSSHWFEAYNDENKSIYRPRQLYVGKNDRVLKLK